MRVLSVEDVGDNGNAKNERGDQDAL